MKRTILWLGLVLIVVSLPAAADERLNPKPVAPATTNAPSQQVIAYYFHGTVRCETCQKIEQQAKEVIERQFKLQLNAQRLVFKPLNYDLPANAHFLSDYKLPCPSLVLVCQKDGAAEKWKLLGDTWELVASPAKFNRYIETEVGKFLRDQSGGACSKTNALPIATSKHR